MSVTFNPSGKVTKRHMDALRTYVPVKEYGYGSNSKYFVDVEYGSRKTACEAMLKRLTALVDAGFIPESVWSKLLEEKASDGFPLFVQSTK